MRSEKMNCLQDIPQEWVGPLLVFVFGYPWWSGIISIVIASVLDGDIPGLFSLPGGECTSIEYDSLESGEANTGADDTDWVEALFAGLEF